MAEILELLQQGQLELEGMVPWGSNYTFLARVCHPGSEMSVVYKPSRGERPLWDFARGTLCKRERAAFLVSEMLEWQLVPPTILRDGPHGQGSVQYFVEHDPQQHYLTFQGQFPEQEQRIVLFDVLINNADRKSGHVLLGDDSHLWAIDHGVCFHTDYKLRTVIWDYAGQPIPTHLVNELAAFQKKLVGNDPYFAELDTLLTRQELDMLGQRLARLVKRSVFPNPGPGRHYPWPLV
ncbi:MAG: SCO1664 family protein [Chloroflexi bacterium]|nr:SCO1664 family protein [Chloroflexota bacterium]MCI0578437.1 SCO1664 family protein [Chloroflexota bacterium]MCI0643883.1 SCO1664 family protein [Chloroflexota bacterium]MCI0729207.1 SCO1664 family protein [Chloroflexota bacterium]